MEPLKKLNTWHLSSNPWNSAITEYVLSSARALAARGHGVTMSVLSSSPAHVRANGYGLACNDVADFSPAAFFQLRRLARAIQPDVVFTYGGRETTLVAMLAAAGFKAQVLRFFGYQPRGVGVLARARWSLSHWPVAAVFCPSEFIASQLRLTASGARFEVVPLGCDEAKFFRAARRRDQANRRAEALVFGRFDPIKNHDGAMAMFQACLHTWPSDEPRPLLRIVGDPANISVDDLKNSAARHQLRIGEDVVIETGRAPDVAALLTGASVGLIPSSGSEIICRVAEEFLLCGTPVLVSGVGSLEEVLFPGAGESYRGENTGQQAARLTRMLRAGLAERDEVRSARASAARVLFSLDGMAGNLERVLWTLAAREKKT